MPDTGHLAIITGADNADIFAQPITNPSANKEDAEMRASSGSVSV
jgi:hypothetical protein